MVKSGSEGRRVKIPKDKYMSYVINISIMKHVHHLGTEMEGENLQIVPKCTSIDTSPTYPTT